MTNPPGDSAVRWPPEPGETSWDRLARLRRLRTDLDHVITAETPGVVAEAKKKGVKVPQLAELWGVTPAWIYTVAPARPKRPKN